MTLTSGAGAFTISPLIRVHAVVDRRSPAFSFLYGVWRSIDSAAGLEFVKTSLLQMFSDRIATPNDRLEDGATILHLVFSSPMSFPESKAAKDPRFGSLSKSIGESINRCWCTF
ncbi:hypothetical protein BJY01DRAFT_214395 [Aspergillus pseudoustus]|uniref:Uncharacterized protein n=1 Tax=Aspergillus pseudoustus TaxID=1810923 RepID=A0ABR4JZL3_9EURO